MNIKIKKIHPEAVAQIKDNNIELVATSVEYDYITNSFIYRTGLVFKSDSDISALILQNNSNSSNACISNQIYTINQNTNNKELTIYFKNNISFEDRVFAESSKTFFVTLINCNDISLAREFMIDYQRKIGKRNPLDFAPYKKGDNIAQMIFINCPTIDYII